MHKFMYEHSHIKQSYLSNDDALLVLSELVAVRHQVNQGLYVERMILSELSSIISKYLPCTTKQETQMLHMFWPVFRSVSTPT